MSNEIKLNEKQYKIFQEAYSEYDAMLIALKAYGDYMNTHSRKGKHGQEFEASYHKANNKYKTYIHTLSEWVGVKTSVLANAIKAHHEKCFGGERPWENDVPYYPSNVIALAA